ncbi:pyridoxal phosphate-dependent aminotransferase [Paludibacterium paludis]|uniref:Putative 8-amino-7-oxononanoate synthase n=1 Tax=Paludibacterium paludis TaxID=1225769 RepID=A0A918P1J8_9NEIS|nr:aminotransferase class I/II-fold pyridoxal phosphate-dependent enzyme [Paludibacterium paludis]GGY12368.1 histidinol-phosphate aminotransferase [Paludibacterium paludis]
MTRYARHLAAQRIANPFPGIVRLEKAIGGPITARIGSNESLPLEGSPLETLFGEAVAELARLYPDPYAHRLREQAAAANGTAPDTIVFDTGADSLILLALRLFCSAGDRVVCTAGTYPTFGYFARGQGLAIIETDYLDRLTSPRVDLDAMAEAAGRHDARLVYLANPDNPTGHAWDMATLRAFRRALPADTLLLLDEAYRDFCDDADSDNGPIDGVIRLRTLSKAFALAGLRVGYAIAPAQWVERADEIRPQYALSSIAQVAAQAALDHPAHSKQLIARTLALKNDLAHILSSHGLRVLPSATNFLAICYDTPDEAARRQKALLAQGIAVHRPPHEATAHLLRVTVHPHSFEPAVIEGLTLR